MSGKTGCRHPDLSEEDIERILNEREGGRTAGRGDSPFTQGFYEKCYEIKKDGKKELPRFQDPLVITAIHVLSQHKYI